MNLLKLYAFLIGLVIILLLIIKFFIVLHDLAVHLDGYIGGGYCADLFSIFVWIVAVSAGIIIIGKSKQS